MKYPFSCLLWRGPDQHGICITAGRLRPDGSIQRGYDIYFLSARGWYIRRVSLR